MKTLMQQVSKQAKECQHQLRCNEKEKEDREPANGLGMTGCCFLIAKTDKVNQADGK